MDKSEQSIQKLIYYVFSFITDSLSKYQRSALYLDDFLLAQGSLPYEMVREETHTCQTRGIGGVAGFHCTLNHGPKQKESQNSILAVGTVECLSLPAVSLVPEGKDLFIHLYVPSA